MLHYMFVSQVLIVPVHHVLNYANRCVRHCTCCFLELLELRAMHVLLEKQIPLHKVCMDGTCYVHVFTAY